MAGGSDSAGKFDCRMAGTATEVGDKLSLADPGGSVERVWCGEGVHCLIPHGIP